MEIAGLTNKGRERARNEDNLFIRQEKDVALVAVADGMGGHLAGNVASSLAVAAVEKSWNNLKRESITQVHEIRKLMVDMVVQANDIILEEANRNPEKSGMGTTLTTGLLFNKSLVISHIGDSRAYLVENNSIHLLTKDHSLVEELIKTGEVKPEDAPNHPQRHILTRALGTMPDPDVDITEMEVHPGSMLFLCTDGLTNLVSDQEILNHALHEEDPHILAEQLINLANSRGGYDNITVIVVTGIGGWIR